MDVLSPATAGAVPARRHPSVVTIGVFDGLHLGHREVIARTVARARQTDRQAAVVTFDRHPAGALGRTPPALLLPVPLRLEILESLGVDRVLLLPFDRDLAATTADGFARHHLLETLDARAAVLGYDTRFGAGRAGDAGLLRALGLAVDVVEPIDCGGQPIKSTRVRAAIAGGDLDAARRLLGRPHVVAGPVVRGAGRGRSIGVPTANVEPGEACLPPPGVYGTRVRLDRLAAPGRPAVTNVGRRPTFETGGALTVEAHLLDVDEDLYGRLVLVEFLTRIRDEMAFDGPGALRARIAADIAAFRAAEPEP